MDAATVVAAQVPLAAALPECRSDLLELASPGPATQHARTAQRMLRSYSVFNMWSS
jgi:hypothetical protein